MTMIGRRTGTLWAVLIVASAGAQSTPDLLTGQLAQLGAQAVKLATALPAFTCNLSAISTEMRGDKVKRQVSFTGTLRTRRLQSGRLHESFEVLTRNGKPFDPDDGMKLPLYVEGGFDSAMRYFDPEEQPCYDFTSSPGRIDFTTRAASPPSLRCDVGLHGFALLDATGNATKIERTVPATRHPDFGLVPFAATKLQQVTLNADTYPLTGHLLAENQRGKSLLRYEATYSSCRLFATTVTIGPSTFVDAPK